MSAPTPQHHPLRAVLVAAAWVIGALPTVLGLSRCPIGDFTHVPCPGCGMSRAMEFLLAGQVKASLHMHPLAVPSIVATALIMMATVWATFTRGTPIDLMKLRAGRFAAATFVAVNVTIFVFWGLRMFGFFGGRVPV